MNYKRIFRSNYIPKENVRKIIQENKNKNEVYFSLNLFSLLIEKVNSSLWRNRGVNQSLLLNCWNKIASTHFKNRSIIFSVLDGVKANRHQRM